MKTRIVTLSLLATTLMIATIRAEDATKGMDHSKMDHSKMDASIKEFTVVGIEYQGTKIWVPGTIIVKKGQKVKINLINKMPGATPTDPNVHGYAIDEFSIKVEVARDQPKTVEFTADKEGLFTIYCQLHPKHVGGQILVLP